MEVQDGFIVSIFNYCDRWCETCAFPSRCRVFADAAQHEAELDPGLRAIAEAPPHPTDVRETPRWLAEMMDELNDAALDTTTIPDPPDPPAHHQQIADRASHYGDRVDQWLSQAPEADIADPAHPRSIVGWFSHLIRSKIHRALTGLAEFDGDREFPPDHEGSAKVALIGLDRSIQAWHDLVSIRQADPELADALVRELTEIRQALEEAIPLARAFVRPGFDEPEEVRRLEATDLT